MTPSTVTTGVANLNAAVAAMGPYLQASTSVRRALLQQAANLEALVDTSLAAASGSLDTFSASPLPADTASGLLGLATAATDSTTLSDLRGVIGRMVLNIEIAG
jgi:hypothetical protein